MPGAWPNIPVQTSHLQYFQYNRAEKVENLTKEDANQGLYKWLKRTEPSQHCHLFAMQVGDTLPSVLLHEGDPKNTVNVSDLFAGKKGVLFAVPGAFTPGCSKVLKLNLTSINIYIAKELKNLIHMVSN